jgi:glutaredoxin-like YruB-family protein
MPASKPKVVVYTAEWCPWCHRAMDWLREHKIAFEAKDVEKDPKTGEEMIKKSGQQGIPVIIVDDKVITGFDVEELKKALKIKQ